MTFTAEDSASTEWIIDLRPGARPRAEAEAPCNPVTECPRTPADQWADVTPGFLIGVLVPCLLVCLLAWLVNRP